MKIERSEHLLKCDRFIETDTNAKIGVTLPYYVRRVSQGKEVYWLGLQTNWNKVRDEWFVLEKGNWIPCDKPDYEIEFEKSYQGNIVTRAEHLNLKESEPYIEDIPEFKYTDFQYQKLAELQELWKEGKLALKFNKKASVEKLQEAYSILEKNNHYILTGLYSFYKRLGGCIESKSELGKECQIIKVTDFLNRFGEDAEKPDDVRSILVDDAPHVTVITDGEAQIVGKTTGLNFGEALEVIRKGGFVRREKDIKENFFRYCIKKRKMLLGNSPIHIGAEFLFSVDWMIVDEYGNPIKGIIVEDEK